MPKKKKKGYLSLIRILAIVGSIVLFIVGGYFRDKFSTYRNEIIDSFLSAHQDDILYWVFENPFNFMLGVAVIILLILSIDAYYYLKNKPVTRKVDKKHLDSRSSLDSNDPFQFVSREPLDKKPHENKWASVEIKNNTSFNIENCYVKMKDLRDIKSGESIMKFNHRNFDWGRGMRKNPTLQNHDLPVKEPITITAGDIGVFDIATTYPNNQEIRFTFWQWHESEVLPIGEYEVIARVFGLWNKKQKHKDQKLVLIYRGGNDISIKIVSD